MRIVTFTPAITDGRIAYPAEGITAFGVTRNLDGRIVGEYYGSADEGTLATYPGTWPPTRTEYRTKLKPGEVMRLLGPAAFAAINAAAYPPNGGPVDAQALFFLESAKYPYSADGMLDVNIPPVTEAMEYFVVAGYITRADADRVVAGQPYEVPL